MSKKRTSKGKQEQYARYERSEKWASNRRRKLARHLKKHPNDEAAKNARIVYRRKKPVARIWQGIRKHYAQVFAQFGDNLINHEKKQQKGKQ